MESKSYWRKSYEQGYEFGLIAAEKCFRNLFKDGEGNDLINNKVKVNKYEIPTLPHYDNNNTYLGDLNELEHLDLRLQILKNNISGYYLINSEGDKVQLLQDGELDGDILEVFSKDLDLVIQIRQHQKEVIKWANN